MVSARLAGPAALRAAIAVAAFLAASTASAASITLNGTIRDFCAFNTTCGPNGSVSGHRDFETEIGGLRTGAVQSTLVGGLPAFSGLHTTGSGFSTAANFDQWFRDTPGINQSQAFSLTLNESAPGSGTFGYSSGSFFPINGQMLGNQGNPQNYHFTLHLEGQTSFKAGDSFTFTGDDDLWVFIDGKLVLDLGGVHPAANATVTSAQLVALGLAPGAVYDLDIFFAERHLTESNFNITTTLRLAPPSEVPEPGSIALLAAAIGAAGVLRRRRQRAE
jgi:fibro-slime domain-containing protein